MPSKLNATKRAILANAASRTDLRVLPVSETVKVSEAMVDKLIQQLLDDGLVAETLALDNDIVSRMHDGNRFTLIITDAGLSKIDTEAAGSSVQQPNSAVSKQDAVVRLLRRQQGASIEEMMTATGWQAHSIRGWMSGAAKKRLGLELVSEKDGSGARRYHVAVLRQSTEA